MKSAQVRPDGWCVVQTAVPLLCDDRVPAHVRDVLLSDVVREFAAFAELAGELTLLGVEVEEGAPDLHALPFGSHAWLVARLLLGVHGGSLVETVRAVEDFEQLFGEVLAQRVASVRAGRRSAGPDQAEEFQARVRSLYGSPASTAGEFD